MVNGRQVRRYNSSWTTRADAEKALAVFLLGLKEEKAAPKIVEARTLGEAGERYLATKEAEGLRSLRCVRLNLDRLLAEFGRETPLAGITADRVSHYKVMRAMDKTRGGKAVSPATVNRELAVVRHLLRLAVEEWGWLDKVPAVRLLKEPEGRLRFLTGDEIARLLAACAESQNPQLHAVVVVALNTGMRLGEIMGLVWERVDFSRGVILLERTKSGRRREVPMNEAADAALHALPGDKIEGRVFRRGSIRTAWENAVERAGLDGFRFHDLRHTFASHMVMRGANLVELRDILGHADLKMTMRYSYLAPEHKRAAVARLDGLTSTQPVDTSVDEAAGARRADAREEVG